MSKRVLVRLDGLGVYETLDDASSALGMEPANISRAVSESGKAKGVPMKWVDRVYAVKDKVSGKWTVAVMNTRNTAYIPVSQVEPRILARDVVEVKDLTQVWYCGTVFAGRDTQ